MQKPVEKTPTAPDKGARSGGLYARVHMSVKAANWMVASLVALLVVATVSVVRHNGFTVRFDTDGGSRVDSVRVLYSETVPLEEQPVKEGYTFTGWYTDRACTNAWDVQNDRVEGSMTLYAGWQAQ